MRARRDEIIGPLKPAEPESARQPHPAPAWVALVAAWLGLIMLLLSIVFVLLPGTRQPRAELEHAAPYSPADRFLPVPIYGIAVATFLGIVVIWQMRRERRPLPQALVMQRAQAIVGIALALLAAIVIYTDVAIRGPR